MSDNFKKLLDLDFVQRKIFKVKNKSGNIQSFTPNSYQRQLNSIVKDYGRNRILVLKCRQIGASTWGASFVSQRTMYQKNKSGLIIADDSENASGLFDIAKRFYANTPEALRPMRRYSNEKALVFDNPDTNSERKGLGSQINITTAGKLSAGRSKTIQYLLASEFAYWPNAAELATGLFQSVPILDNTAIIIESTANGVSGKGAEFYNRCMRAMDGDTEFNFVFFSWLDNPEYEMNALPGMKLTDEEKDLIGRHPQLSLRKLAFRRYKIKNELGSALILPEDQFDQEYPLTPEHAFVSSGRPVFKADIIHKLIKRAKQAQPYSLRGDKLEPDPRGLIFIQEKPRDSMPYAIGADVAEGLATGDDSAFCVLDKGLNQVCWYAGKIEPDRFGDMLVKIGKYYNGAVLAPETNNHGHATMAAIKNLNYYNVYKREVKEELGHDITAKVGWNTNVKTKMLMIDELVGAIRDDVISINCTATLREMLGLSVEDDGNIVLNGKDRTVAAAIALQAIKQAIVVGMHRAHAPGTGRGKDVSRMTIEEKIKHYGRGK